MTTRLQPGPGLANASPSAVGERRVFARKTLLAHCYRHNGGAKLHAAGNVDDMRADNLVLADEGPGRGFQMAPGDEGSAVDQKPRGRLAPINLKNRVE